MFLVLCEKVLEGTMWYRASENFFKAQEVDLWRLNFLSISPSSYRMNARHKNQIKTRKEKDTSNENRQKLRIFYQVNIADPSFK